MENNKMTSNIDFSVISKEKLDDIYEYFKEIGDDFSLMSKEDLDGICYHLKKLGNDDNIIQTFKNYVLSYQKKENE